MPGISIVRIVVVCAANYYRKVIDEKGNPVANTRVTTDGCQHSD
ncbi:hypothetical protein [Terrimonas alba]